MKTIKQKSLFNKPFITILSEKTNNIITQLSLNFNNSKLKDGRY